ncbi:MAG: gamma-glutamyl-gamma-aminobutyrate hydrolase family protein [Planctomycetota bacterium]
MIAPRLVWVHFRYAPALLALALAGSRLLPAEDNLIKGFEGIYDTLDRLDKETASCVVLIDLTDPSGAAANLARPGGLWRLRWLQARLTALSGLDCYCFHYTQLKRDSLERPVVKAVVLRPPSPAGMLKCEAAREELWAMIRESRVPMIGFCGGFHQVYLAYGGKCADMRRLKPGETDPNPAYAPGRLKEWGFCKVKVVKRDPLFEGLGEEMDMLQQHVSECSVLPDEFELVASSDVCRVQAIKHKTRLIYATQFHPEAYEEGRMDGKRLLLNFFQIAGVRGEISR